MPKDLATLLHNDSEITTLFYDKISLRFNQ